MKRIVMLLGALCLQQAYAQKGKVGINTENPTETLDVKGTARVQELPQNGTGQIYNGANDKATTFTATRTLVSDDNGVLGYVEGLPGSGSATTYTAGNGISISNTNVISRTGLEKVTQNEKSGHRLIGANPNNYGNVGNYAVDLSYSSKASTTYGATGVASFVTGYQTTASGQASTAMGYQTTASGYRSTAMGESSTASGNSSTTMGYKTTASGYRSTAMGADTTASGITSTAMGESSTASGQASTAMGYHTTAPGDASTAMGFRTTASGQSSTAMGESSTASGNSSTAMGYQTTASGKFSTAMGENSSASGVTSTAMGWNAKSIGFGSYAMGGFLESTAGLSMVIGHYNHTTTPNDPNYNETNQSYTYFKNDYEAFVIGNGESSTAKSNAFIVLRNGKTGIGVSNRKPVEMLEVEGAIKLSTTTSACSDTNRGTIKYENDNFYGCKSTGWVLLNN